MEIDILWLLGFLGGTALTFYALFKFKLHKIRVFFDVWDDAMMDNKVTEDEARAIWEALKAIWKRQPKS